MLRCPHCLVSGTRQSRPSPSESRKNKKKCFNERKPIDNRKLVLLLRLQKLTMQTRKSCSTLTSVIFSRFYFFLKNFNSVSEIITDANISNPPKAIFSVIGSPINIIEVIAPKRISVERIREAVDDGTYF